MNNTQSTDARFEIAKQFVMKRQSVTSHVLMDAMKLNAVQAVVIMCQLEEEGIISKDWNKYLGGFPVLANANVKA